MRLGLTLLLLFASVPGALPAQIVTRGLAAQYAMTDASGTNLPDSSGNANDGVLVDNPTVGPQGVTFARASSQYASLPPALSTTVQTIQIFMDCDRYLNAGTRAAVLGNSVNYGLKIWCGSYNGRSSPGLDKYMDVDMGTTLASDLDATATTVALASFERITANHYFIIDAENILCAAVAANVGTNCVRGGAGSKPASHTAGTPVFGGAVGNGSTSDLLSVFNLASPSLFTLVLDPASSRMLDNTTETVYNGFSPASNTPFTIANNVGTWQLGGGPGEFYNGTIYYVLMYTTELTTAEIQQNVAAVQSIMNARGVPARTDGFHTGNIVVCEGTSIEVLFGPSGWCGGMVLNGSPQVLLTGWSGQIYGNAAIGILGYTSARDGPLTNPPAARNVMLLGAPTNDFSTSFTIGQIETTYTSVVTAVRAEGYIEVYCGLMLSRTGAANSTGGSYDAAHDAWNAWLQANYVPIGCTNVITWDARFTADGAWNNPDPAACGGNACFSGDGVHPSAAGFAAMSLLAAPIVNAATPTPAALTISTSHPRNFVRGQTNAAYTVTVSNAASAGPTSGTVSVSETPSPGLTIVSIAGAGWNCSGTNCTRSDVLNPGASYPAITVLFAVDMNSASLLVNQVSVSGGGSAPANASDSTVVPSVRPRSRP
ncbi:MAG TPA: hypothetical protein VN841_26240 [Bryobacteraceae bacterium]|nr:hypothetical protein [Bryobacteraceae bacterium]